MLGLPRSFNQDAPVYKTDSGWYTGLFIQDEFRIHPRLMLSLGLRHEIQFPMTDPQDRKNTVCAGRAVDEGANRAAGDAVPGR